LEDRDIAIIRGVGDILAFLHKFKATGAKRRTQATFSRKIEINPVKIHKNIIAIVRFGDLLIIESARKAGYREFIKSSDKIRVPAIRPRMFQFMNFIVSIKEIDVIKTIRIAAEIEIILLYLGNIIKKI